MMILDRIEELLQEVSKLTASNAEEIEALRLKSVSYTHLRAHET